MPRRLRRTNDEPSEHSHRARPAGDRHLLASGARRRHRLPVRPGAARSGDHAAGERRHRGADPPRVRKPQGGGGSRRWLPRPHGQDERLPHRPGALRQGERDHGELLQQALPGARGSRRRPAAAWRAGRDRVRPAPGLSRRSLAAAAAGPSPGERAEQRPVTALRGVGAALAARLARLGVTRVSDLLFVLPLRYEDRTRVSAIGSLLPGVRAAVEGEVQLTEIAYRGRRQLLCRISDGSGMLTLRSFHFSASQSQGLARGTRLRCFGEVRRGALGLEMVHPEYRRLTGEAAPLEDTLTPIYPLTEGVPQGRLRALIGESLRELERAVLRDWLPREAVLPPGLPSLREALHYLHRPPREAQLAELAAGRHPAQRRLAFEELLAHHLTLGLRKRALKTDPAWALADGEGLARRFLEALPFALTRASRARCAMRRRISPRACRWCGCCRVMSAAARPWWPRPPPRVPQAAACRRP